MVGTPGRLMKAARAGRWRSIVISSICVLSALVSEIDGPSHESGEQRAKHATRDAWIASAGLRLLRLSNELVIGTPELAEQRIRDALGV